MMKQIIIKTLVIVLFLLNSADFTFGQNVNWQPTMREIVINYKDSVIRANVRIKHEKIHPSDKLTYYWYSGQSINWNTGGYAGELLHGPYYVYNTEKKLITKGNFDSGLMVDEWKYWNNDGTLKLSMEYKNGLLNGDVKVYSETGDLIETKKYKSGIEQSETIGISKLWKWIKINKETPDSTVISDSSAAFIPAENF